MIEFLLKNMLPANTFWVGVQRKSNPDVSWVTQNDQRVNEIVTLSFVEPTELNDDFLAISYMYKSDEKTPLQVYVRKQENETLPSVCYHIRDVDFF